MLKYLLAAVAVFFLTPVLAANVGPPDGLWQTLDKTQRDTSSRRAYGTSLFLLGTTSAPSASSAAVDWGFTSNYVVICIRGGLDATGDVYIRLASTVVPTNDTDFISGGIANAGPPAIPMSGGGDGTDQHCQVHPWRTDGVAVYAQDGQATIDISAY